MTFWRLLYTLLLAVTLNAVAEDKASPPAGPACHYLFVVDTSYSMSRVSGMARQTVFDLVFDGMQGQMQKGDWYGIWTFDEQVATNGFAPLLYDPSLRRVQAFGASNFLKDQHGSKNTRMDRLWAELSRFSPGVNPLLVVVITDGNDRFTGTPFDERLNTFFEKNYKEYNHARKPFVITMVAVDGRFKGCTINGPRESISFQDMVKQVAAYDAANPPKETKPEPAPTPQPKTVPAPAVTNAVTPVAHVPAAVPQPVSLATTRTTPPPAAPKAAIPVSETEPAVPATNKVEAPVKTEVVVPTNTATTISTQAVQPLAQEPKPESKPTVATPKQELPAQGTSQAVMESRPAPASEVHTPAPATNPAAAVEPQQETPSRPAETQQAQEPVRDGRTTAESAQPVSSKAPATTTAQPDLNPSNAARALGHGGQGSPILEPVDWVRTGILIGLIALLLLGIGLLYWMLRRPRPSNHHSFITQSIDRDMHLK